MCVLEHALYAQAKSVRTKDIWSFLDLEKQKAV